ncbi:Hydrophobic protein OSR8 [Platanthera zijinensis]|uniref:Hydrophobic protein OSR8 n=1 Tax=Platanthera zijinensis TaxID=2320716 RepID=A0AAP0AX09_9ASPA
MEFCICLLLTILGYIPGIVYTIDVIVSIDPERPKPSCINVHSVFLISDAIPPKLSTYLLTILLCCFGCNSSKTEYSEEAILISDAIRANLDVLDDRLLKNLRQFRGNLDANLVIEVLRLVKIPKLSMKFFLWAGRQIGYSHNTITYDAADLIFLVSMRKALSLNIFLERLNKKTGKC